MTDLPTNFVAHITTAEGRVSVIVHLNKIELSTWGLYDSVPWMKLSSFISEGSVTESRTVDGELIIVNWKQAAYVTYENPWVDIPREKAVKFAR